MLFPQQKHSQRDSGQWKSNPTHLLCRWLNDVPECSLATLWPPCGVLLEVAHPQFHFLDPPWHTHTNKYTCSSWLWHVEGIWRWKCVCGCGKSCCVLPLCINYTCGMWVSDWNEYFTAFNQCHCQSDGASGCVTWVIKDAVSHTHTCKSQRLCLQYETEVLQRFTNESKLDLGCFKAMGPMDKYRLLLLSCLCLTLISKKLFNQARGQWKASFRSEITLAIWVICASVCCLTMWCVPNEKYKLFLQYYVQL